MTPKSKKIEIAITITALLVLVAVWAINGYEDTWLYVSAMIIVLPATWFYFGKKNK